MRLMDVDEFLYELGDDNVSVFTDEIKEIIEKLPTIEFVKIGHWVKVANENLHNAYRCSECGHMIYSEPKYLGNYRGCYCGAIMLNNEERK